MELTLDEIITSELEDKIHCNHRIYFQDAANISKLPLDSVDLVITSPPYWKIKDYGNIDQIGFHDSLDEYMKKLTTIFTYCVKAMKPNSKLCINIGDQFLKANTPPKKVYQIIPLHALLINSLITEMDEDIVYLGSIQWEKVSTSHTSGGGQIMGSYPFPKSGYFFVNREYIAIFRKIGKIKKKNKPDPELRQFSRLTLNEWREYFKDVWRFQPVNQNSHVAMFPEELPKRLIKMYSFIGDTVLDPFLGSGTTTLASSNLGRNSIGYEIGFTPKTDDSWKSIIKKKVKNPYTIYNYPLESNNDKFKEIPTKKIQIYNRFRFSS